MRTTSQCLAIVPLLLSVSLGAQQPATLDGKWLASFRSEGGGDRFASLTLSAGGGTWKDSSRGLQGRNNPCLSAAPAVTIQDRSPSGVVFQIGYSKALAGCADRTVTAHLIDPNTLEGTFEDGRPIKLTRE